MSKTTKLNGRELQKGLTRAHIPDHTVFELWSKAGGRCEFRGCNKPLYEEGLTCAKVNLSNIAHIVASSPNGPRGDEERSPLLARNVSNLMLMCKEHHNDILDKFKDQYNEVELLEMKREHEARIKAATSILPEMKSKIITYSAPIGKRAIHLNADGFVNALFPHRYPDGDLIKLGLNSSWSDDEMSFWEFEAKHLKKEFGEKVKPLLRDGKIRHLSIFALAPQPLLMLLGSLFTDIYPADVFHLNRAEQNWRWQKDYEPVDFIVKHPSAINGVPTLNFSLSGIIDDSRINKALKADCDIWTITIKNPHPDFLKAKNQVCAFAESVRMLLEKIKSKYPHGIVLNVFPAMPAALNVEFGRLILPRADMPMKIYNSSNNMEDFEYALTLNNEKEE